MLENVKDGAREVADMVDRFNAISAEMGDPKDDTDFDALMEEMGELQGKIDAVDGWTSTTSSKSRWRRSAVRRRTGRSRTFRAVRSAASR